MLANSISATPWGIDARAVEVEVDVQGGLPQVQIAGLPDTAVKESRERVRAAIKNCGSEMPARSVTINQAPADLEHGLGCREALLPSPTAAEAAALGSVPIVPLDSLVQAVEHLLGNQKLEPTIHRLVVSKSLEAVPDLAEVRGQETAKRALEIAAAGGHNLLLLGPDTVTGASVGGRRLSASLHFS